MIAYKAIHYIDPHGSAPVSTLTELIKQKLPRDMQPVVLCIGSDRLTGDSLGPITGTKLKQGGFPLPVYGTLDSPVHALNLRPTVEEIYRTIPHCCIIAVDACLGTHIGSVTLTEGAIIPGTGVSRSLFAVGHLSLTGIVGSDKGNAYSNLSTVRLNRVVTLANLISTAILHSFTVNDVKGHRLL